MNKKGFTLIELLVVITIMAILGVFVTISFFSSLKKANQENCDDFVKKAEDAACVAAATYRKGNNSNLNSGFDDDCMTTGCNLTLGWLYDAGYFNETKDACTNSDINRNVLVKVEYNNGQKECKYMGIDEYAK